MFLKKMKTYIHVFHICPKYSDALTLVMLNINKDATPISNCQPIRLLNTDC